MKLNPNAGIFVPGFKPPPKDSAQAAPTKKTTTDSWESVQDSKAKVQATASQSQPNPASEEFDDELKKELGRMALEEGVSVDDLLSEENEKPSQKPVEVVEEDNREHLNIVFIGHVDAGKSTLSGQILYLSGLVDKRTLEKYEREAKEKNRESWFFAYIMDTSEDERAKGKTVEVGRAVFETPNKRYTILDAPGHQKYVPNMIGGCSQADVALLVISARRGEFETGFHKGGQTREHAVLAKTLGVKRLVVIVNKMDDPTVEWQKQRYDEIVDSLNPFLKQTGYNPKDVTFVPVSGQKGTNIRDPMPEGVCPWYTGKSLLQILDDLPPVERLPDFPLRIPVIDRIKDAGKVWIMGKVEAGTVKIGEKLMLMPNKQIIEVTEIGTDTKMMKKAKPGENIKLAIKGIEEENIRSGFVVCDIKRPVPCQTTFEAQLIIMDLPAHAPLFTAGYSCIIHIHSAVEECSVKVLLAEVDKKPPHPVIKQKPKFVKIGSMVRCILSCAQPICLELFADVGQMGRFTLRDEQKTIAFGRVTSLGPKKPTN